MTKEKLDQLLFDGAITQEEYDVLIKGIDTEPSPSPKVEDKKPSTDDLEVLVQKAVDRATNKLGNENKSLRERLEKLQREKLTEEERKQIELQEKETAIAERERAIKASENRLYAIKAIKSAELDDGSSNALDLIDFVMGEDEAAIDSKVKAFSELVKRFVKAEVDKTFRDNGRNPAKGGNTQNGNNPYMKDSFNLTEQMRLETENPELAKAYMAAAGIK